MDNGRNGNQEEIDHLYRPITSIESKTVIKKSSNKQKLSSGPDGLLTLMITLATWRKQESEYSMAFVWRRG